jgi:hypothetical protein
MSVQQAARSPLLLHTLDDIVVVQEKDAHSPLPAVNASILWEDVVYQEQPQPDGKNPSSRF